jgi:NAD(P)-dependent dehydrogenase (short-subunit alcohol dehydrogenase family)
MADTYSHIVLVTGANQGIGFEIAKKLATEHADYHVILSGRRAPAVDDAVARLRALGLANLEPLVLDITSDESIAAAAAAVASKHGRLDALINNAAASVADQAKSFPRDEWLRIYNVNVAGTALVTDAFLPLLEKAKGVKRIVNLSSGLGGLAEKADKAQFAHRLEYGAYSVTKAALNSLTLHYAARYDDDETWKINMVCPGLCSTNLNGFLAAGEDPAMGAIVACRAATLGVGGETGTFSDRHGVKAW